MAERKTIRLVDLDQPVGEVELPSGRTFEVRAIDGVSQQIRSNLLAGKATADEYWVIAARLLPEATPEEIKSLSATMVGIIVEISAGHLDRVLEYAAALERSGKTGAPAAAAPPSELETGSKTS